jgi:hypothetical protein
MEPETGEAVKKNFIRKGSNQKPHKGSSKRELIDVVYRIQQKKPQI